MKRTPYPEKDDRFELYVSREHRRILEEAQTLAAEEGLSASRYIFRALTVYIYGKAKP